ncbi:MAG TPA: surface lipoprotein assembly modifier [Candidimonas sp.]|nr:surface lipoprotein assembly modifier [Candidimonas sp.]
MTHPITLRWSLLTLCLSSSVWAQTPAQPTDSQQGLLSLGEYLIREGEPAAACYWLGQMQADASLEPNRQYLLSHCLRDQGLVNEATSAMEKTAALLPNASTPRLELAELYSRQGFQAQAQALTVQAAQRGKANDTSDKLRTLAERLSGNDPAALARARSQSKPWQIEAFAGLIYDSNINGGPTSDLISAVVGSIPGIIRLSPESHPIHSWGAVESVSGQYNQILNARTSVLYQVSASHTDYFGNSNYRNDSLSLAPALIYQGDGYSTSVQPILRYTRQANKVQQSDAGITGRYSKVLNPQWSLSSAVEYLDKTVRQYNERDAKSINASLGVNVLLRPNLKAGADFSVSRERAQTDIYSYQGRGLSAYALWQVNPDWQLIANYRHQRNAYDAPMPFFADSRKDRQHSVALTSLWDISRYTGYDMVLRMQYLHVDNPSNVGFYDFSRELATVGLQLRF